MEPITSKEKQRIAASIRDQILDTNLGLITRTEWAKRYDEAEALGVKMDLRSRLVRGDIRKFTNAREAGL